MSIPERAKELLGYLSPEDRSYFESLAGLDKPIWAPHPGRQTEGYDCAADELFYGGAAGGGKRLDVSTPIATPSGWTTMGQLQPGNSVFDERGRSCRVTAVSPVEVAPESYLVTFDDGSQIRACAEHQWLTYSAKELSQLTRLTPEFRDRRRASSPSAATGRKSSAFTASLAARNKARAQSPLIPTGSVRTTRQIAATLLTPRGRRNHAVSVAGALERPEADLPLDPYVLGVWLGDGHSIGGGVTGADPDIFAEIERAGFTVTKRSGIYEHGVLGLQAKLRALGVLNNKHVPASYLAASRPQRLAILQGLMDADGYCEADGKAEFCNTNRSLAEAALELALSLGLKATLRQGRAMLGGKDCGPKYRVCFTATVPVFRLRRKLDKVKASVRRVTRFRYVVSCERCDPVPMRCIAVDSPSRLYLAGRHLIPTHNSDLLLGLALTRHRDSIIYRREYPQLRAMIQRSWSLLAGRGSYNSQAFIWRLKDGRTLEFGAVQFERDVERFRGRPHDFVGFDELPTLTRLQFIFLTTWLRSAVGDSKQRLRIVATGNPPATAEGRWVVQEWAPWLDVTFPDPAKPGELRYFYRDEEAGTESGLVWSKVPGPARLKSGEEVVKRSRTFIPAKVDDNLSMLASGYKAVLQALPEPLRSQMLHGRFDVGADDHPFQVIPTGWVLAAQARWASGGPPDAAQVVGCDMARGGRDRMVLCGRRGNWVEPLLKIPGTKVKDGHAAATVIRQYLAANPGCCAVIDVVGVGSSAYDILKVGGGTFRPFHSSNKTMRRDRSGLLGFANLRAAAYWHMRELLSPESGAEVALPPDPELLADLTCPHWEERPGGILIESKDDIRKRIGRSPDTADACVMAFFPLYEPALPLAVDAGPRRGLYDDSRDSSMRRRGFLGLSDDKGPSRR